MSKFKSSQSGFSAIEGLLVVLVLSVISFGGYYVWHTQKANSTNSNNTSAKSETHASNTPTDPYVGWQSFSLKYEKLAFRYPAGWTIQDDSAAQGLTPNADSVTLTASDGFNVSIGDGWDGGGDSLYLATDSPAPVTFVGDPAYLVFSHVKCFGPDPCNANAVRGATLMLKPSSDYGPNKTVGYFPQDKNAHGDPNVNNGGSTMLISAGYSGTNAKTFSTVAQAQGDPEFKNLVLILKSAHY